MTGLEGKTVIEASNRLGGEAPPAGHASDRRVHQGGPWRPNSQGVQPELRQAARRRCSGTEPKPDNIWVGDRRRAAAVEQLTHDAGMQPRHAGPLDRAATRRLSPRCPWRSSMTPMPASSTTASPRQKRSKGLGTSSPVPRRPAWQGLLRLEVGLTRSGRGGSGRAGRGAITNRRGAERPTGSSRTTGTLAAQTAASRA